MTRIEQTNNADARRHAEGQAVGRGVDGRDLAIGALSVTAVILLTALVTVQALRPQPATAFTTGGRGAGQGGRVGKYVVGTAMLDPVIDLVFVHNAENGLMNVYAFNAAVGQSELVNQINMNELTEDVLQLRQELRELRERRRRPR
jgi:hypothetical protein